MIKWSDKNEYLETANDMVAYRVVNTIITKSNKIIIIKMSIFVKITDKCQHCYAAIHLTINICIIIYVEHKLFSQLKFLTL